VAGAVLVQAAGAADPVTFRPLLSVEVFLIVLVGGAGEPLGPALGLTVFEVTRWATSAACQRLGYGNAVAEPLAIALQLPAALAAARFTVLPRVRTALGRRTGAEPTAASRSGNASAQNGAVIEARGIAVSFGGIRALKGITFDAGPGECHALIGPNGSGKTTLLRVMTGALTADTGTVELDGSSIDDLGPHARAKAGVIRTMQDLAMAVEATVLDNVIAGMEPVRSTGLVQAVTSTPLSRLEQRDVRATAFAVLAELGIAALAEDRAASLSFGQLRLVQLARALAGAPRVLLLDEPSAGLDAVGTATLVSAVRGLCASGATVVLVTHDLGLMRAAADRVTVLDAGTAIAAGTPQAVTADPHVIAAYLGRRT
jgi:ABC-type branched-subunit amino acid transport system ATPase component